MMLRVLHVCALFYFSVEGVLATSAGCRNGSGEGEFWTVRMRGGAVRGRRAEAGYYSFFGIPYGAPPTGEHRFKPPRPAAPWPGVLEADSRRPCPQPPNPYSDTTLGDEDCLTLDVFAPSPLPARAPRAVYFHLHGGAYLFDQAPLTTFAVRYMLGHDVIVVSVNYREGALGWLCLGTKEAPGNAGLRDMLLALRWVRDNIVVFGGNPARVALVGHSAGAYAAHTLALSPAASGLYHAVVAADGTALIDKHLSTYPITVARTYAKKLGFESDDVAELTKFYKEASVDKLLNQSLEFTKMYRNGDLGFGVCVERPVCGVRRVVSQAPALSLAVNTKPVMFTYCNDEGSIKAQDLIKKNRIYNDDFPALMPSNLDFPSGEAKYAASNETRLFYFGKRKITTDSRVAFTNFWGDREYVYQAVFSASEHARFGVPAYLLEFTYEGGLSQKKPQPVAPGAGHPDFFHYLMPLKEVENEDDLRVVEEITSIVAHFVKTGRARASAAWQAVEPGLRRVARLRLGRSGVEPRDAGLTPALALWHRLYTRYRRTNYTQLSEDRKYSTET